MDFALAPYVKKSFKKALWHKFEEWLIYNGAKANEFDKSNFEKIDFDLLHYSRNGNYTIDYTIIADDGYDEYPISDAIEYMDHFLDIGISAGEKIYNLACKAVEEETMQAMEAMIHNFNTLHSRAGRVLIAG